jgi:hypothetical protein
VTLQLQQNGRQHMQTNASMMQLAIPQQDSCGKSCHPPPSYPQNGQHKAGVIACLFVNLARSAIE